MNSGVKSTRKPSGRESSDFTGIDGSPINHRPVQHGLDWLDATDGLFGEREAQSNGTEQFTLDIYRTAAHTLQNAGFSQRSAAETGEDDGLFGPEILQDTEDFDLELFDPIALENGFSDAAESRADVLQWEELLTPGQRK